MPGPSFESSKSEPDQEKSAEKDEKRGEAEPITREQLRDEYVDLEERTRELSTEDILADSEIREELAAFSDKCEVLSSSDRVGLLLEDSGDPGRFLEVYAAAAKASVREYALDLSAEAGFVEISRESLEKFEELLSEKLDELIPPPDQASKGIFISESPGLRSASERTGEVFGGDTHRSYATEVEVEGAERGHVFVRPREGEVLELGPASPLGQRRARWSRPSDEGKREVLEFTYDVNNGLVRLERDGETIPNPEVVNEEFAAFRDRLLEYRPSPVSTEESVQRWVQRVEAMTLEERTKFLTDLIGRITAEGSEQANRK